jgi:hypothetical protein
MTYIVQKIDALKSLNPNVEIYGYDDNPIWNSNIDKPTESEIQTEITRLQAEYDSQEYARLRQAEYPSIQECVHAMLDGDLDELQAKRQEVKARFPK